MDDDALRDCLLPLGGSGPLTPKIFVVCVGPQLLYVLRLFFFFSFRSIVSNYFFPSCVGLVSF